jgi:hypothetical protein
MLRIIPTMMAAPLRGPRGRAAAFGIAIVALTALSAHEAAADPSGLLETLFGTLTRPPRFATPTPLPATPSQMPDRAPLSITVTPQLPSGRHGIAGYCVRLCDGRYFPLPAVHGKATPAKMCEALCPSAPTRVYWGGDINWSRASNGGRYTDLETAFKYRSEFARDCTCNGKDSVGTAAISLAADFTLRPGDIVARDDGFSVYVGSDDKLQSPQFVPVDTAEKIPDELREQLVEARIRPPAVMLEGHPVKRLTVQTRIMVGFAPFDSQSSNNTPPVTASSWIDTIPGRTP